MSKSANKKEVYYTAFGKPVDIDEVLEKSTPKYEDHIRIPTRWLTKRVYSAYTQKTDAKLYKRHQIFEYPDSPELIKNLNTIGEWKLLNTLLTYCDRNTLSCFPSYEAMHRTSGMSYTTISKAKERLIQKGLLKVEKSTWNGIIGRPTNKYILILEGTKKLN